MASFDVAAEKEAAVALGPSIRWSDYVRYVQVDSWKLVESLPWPREPGSCSVAFWCGLCVVLFRAGSRGIADEANLFFTSDCITYIKSYEGQPQGSLDELLETEGVSSAIMK
jgi:hypothetical protein